MNIDLALKELNKTPRTWLVTGAAGFIGSNLCLYLLRQGQRVIGLDNFATGLKKNIEDIELFAQKNAATSWSFTHADIQDSAACNQAVTGVDFVLHQAAIGSVPRSIDDPLFSHGANVDGFIKLITAAQKAGVKKIVYASSSAVYGDDEVLPKTEEATGAVLSPYAATKLIDEIYAQVFHRCYGTPIVGLRYFNVFGPRQDPKGPYAAVVPLWIEALLNDQVATIYGDGSSTRDFCFIENVIEANILAALSASHTEGQTYNVGLGERTDLKQLFDYIQTAVSKLKPHAKVLKPAYKAFRIGDIPHSFSDISKAKEDLGFAPSHSLMQGLEYTVAYHLAKGSAKTTTSQATNSAPL